MGEEPRALHVRPRGHFVRSDLRVGNDDRSDGRRVVDGHVGRHREGGRRGGEREGDEELHVAFLGLRLRDGRPASTQQARKTLRKRGRDETPQFRSLSASGRLGRAGGALSGAFSLYAASPAHELV